jgi:hypothetical protein
VWSAGGRAHWVTVPRQPASQPASGGRWAGRQLTGAVCRAVRDGQNPSEGGKPLRTVVMDTIKDITVDTLKVGPDLTIGGGCLASPRPSALPPPASGRQRAVTLPSALTAWVLLWRRG